MVLAERLAQYATKLQFSDLPAKVVHETKRRFIDSFATAVGAMDADAFAIAKKCALRASSNPGATLLGGGRSSVEWATFVNGLLIRYLDYNDTYLSLEPAHPSDNLAPVLAVGESVGADGKSLIAAAVLAYEIQCRLCDAASLPNMVLITSPMGRSRPPSRPRNCSDSMSDKRPTQSDSPASATSRLRQTRAGDMSMWKGCAFANAARNGVFAAVLAAEGMTGPAPIFEGELGLMKLVLRTKFSVAPMGGEGGGSDFMLPKTYIKFWPVEYHAQSAVEAILHLRPQIGDWRNVNSIDIHTFDAAVDIIGKDPEKYRPKTRETADHSMPYCVAVALMEGDVGLSSFDDVHLANADLIALTNNVKLHRDVGCNAGYPKGIPNRLTVTLNDGRQLVKEVAYPRGHAENPMTDAEVEKKFRTLVEPVYGTTRANQILKACWDLEKLKSASDLMKLLDQST